MISWKNIHPWSTYLVRKGGHSLGELHEDFTLNISEAHSLSATRTARAPGVHDETKTEITFKLNRSKLFSIAFVLHSFDIINNM